MKKKEFFLYFFLIFFFADNVHVNIIFFNNFFFIYFNYIWLFITNNLYAINYHKKLLIKKKNCKKYIIKLIRLIKLIFIKK